MRSVSSTNLGLTQPPQARTSCPARVSLGSLVQCPCPRLWPGHARGELVIMCAKTKEKKVYICTKCGQEHYKWQGKCKECGQHSVPFEPEIKVEYSGGVGGSPGLRAAEQQISDVTDSWSFQDTDPHRMAALAPPKTKRKGGWVEGSTTARSIVSLRKTKTEKEAAPGRVRLTGRTGEEINRVLGGGIMQGSLVLMGGEPGVGKSTLLLQLAAMASVPSFDFDREMVSSASTATLASLAEIEASGGSSIQVQELDEDGDGEEGQVAEGTGHEDVDEQDSARTVLYVSGEEMADQVYDRAVRMGLGHFSRLFVLSECELEKIGEQICDLLPTAVVIDSIQTVYLKSVANSEGSLEQLKQCTQYLLRIAKDLGITVFVIGHVTKTGEIAGPRKLEHMVDTTLYLEGQMSDNYRLLRVKKNRYGASDQIGIFHMDEGGMHAVQNPTAIFLGTRSMGSASSVVTAISDGNRTLLLEVQALSAPSHNPGIPPARQPIGVSRERFGMLTSVMSKVLPTCRLYNQSVYCNVVGGIQMKEPAGDLAVAVSIASSYYNTPVPRELAVIGEIDLSGGIRQVPRVETRLAELAKLGFDRCVIPKFGDIDRMQQRVPEMKLVPCATLHAALIEALGSIVDTHKPPKQRRRGGPKDAGDSSAVSEEEEEHEEEEFGDY